MKNKWKVFLALLFLPQTLAELLSGNITYPSFFTPGIILLMVFAYGIPVLIIRETAVRWKLGLAGILILGLAYGIFNEGICAKTLLLQVKVPLSSFDNYGFSGGINFSWSFFIIIWHAFHSVLYPLLLIWLFFPQARDEKLIGNKTLIFLTLLFSVFALIFVVVDKINPIHYQFIFIMAILALVGLARISPRQPGIAQKQANSAKPALLGFCVIFFYIGLLFLGELKISLLLFYALGFIVIYLFFLLLRKNDRLTLPSLVLFASGDYMFFSAFVFLAMLGRGYLPGMITAVLFEIIFALLIFSITRKNLLQK